MAEKIRVVDPDTLYPFIQLFRGAGKIVVDEHIEKQVQDPDFLRSEIEKAAESGARYYYTLYDKWFMYQTFDDPNFKPHPRDRKHWPGDEIYFKYCESVYKICKEFGLKFGTECLRTMDLAVGFWKQHPQDCGGFWSLGEAEINPDGSFELRCPNPGRMEGNPGESPLYYERIVGIFAFREEKIDTEDFYKWRVQDVRDISREVEYTVKAGEADLGNTGVLPPQKDLPARAGEIEISGKWKKPVPFYKVYAIAFLRAGEFDYADSRGLKWAKKLVDEFDRRGVKMNVFYQDEPHIWWHWGNWGKYPDGVELPRIVYMTDKFARRFRKKWKTDFAKNILTLLPSPSKEGRFTGSSVNSLLFRARYYDMLQDLFVKFNIELREYAEKKWGNAALIGHDTWCNTIGDHCAARELRVGSLASWKYRKWWKNGGRSDHGESGHVEFDYYGQALATSWSKGAKPEWGYYGYWSLRQEGRQAGDCISDIESAFGLASRFNQLLIPVRGISTRKSKILSIFPECFAFHYPMHQWYTATGYADWLTDLELAGRAKIRNGKIEWNENIYDVLIVQYVPVLRKESFKKIRELVNSGGTVIWLGPPVLRYFDGKDAGKDFETLAGASTAVNDLTEAKNCAGRKVKFLGEFSGLGEVAIEDCGRLHYWIDFGQTQPVREVGYRSLVFPLRRARAREVAEVEGKTVATLMQQRGRIIYLGFCPSFEIIYKILERLGFIPEVVKLSHDTGFFITEFANGAIFITRHLWNNLDPEKRDLKIDLKIYGRNVKYEGNRILSYLLDKKGRLIGFAGLGCTGIRIGSRQYTFSDTPENFGFGPVEQTGSRNAFLLRIYRIKGEKKPARISLPVDTTSWKTPVLIIDREKNGEGEVVCKLPKAESVVVEIPAEDTGADIFIADVG